MPEHSADSALHIGAFRIQQTITLPIHNDGCAGSLCQKNKPKRTLIAFVVPLVPKLARLCAGLNTSYQTYHKDGTHQIDFCFPLSPSLFTPEGHILGIGSVAGVEVLAVVVPSGPLLPLSSSAHPAQTKDIHVPPACCLSSSWRRLPRFAVCAESV